MKIIVEERQDDYIAYIDKLPEFFGVGKSSAYAIGDLINAHSNYFKISIQYNIR